MWEKSSNYKADPESKGWEILCSQLSADNEIIADKWSG